MATIADPGRAMLAEPGMEHVDGQIALACYLMNVGERPFNSVQVTAITLGRAVRISPAGFPIVIPVIGPSGTGSVSARFSSAGLTVGAKYLLTVSATYTFNGATYGLTLNRYVQIPAPGPAAVPALKARVQTSLAPNYWNYTLFNDEPAGSNRFISSFSLSIAAPVTVTGTPSGWAVETDGRSYVLWYADEYLLPYPHHIAPGASLGGFQLMSARTRSEATASLLASWNHASDDADLTVAGYALTPYRFS